MKKFLSIILCVLMIVPCFAICAFAEDASEEELTNVALNSSLKASSTWNASTPAKATINGRIESDFGGGHENYWSPSAPGRDNTASKDLSTIQYTFKGLNKGYKIVETVDLYVTQYPGCSSNNVQYTVKALINGVWTQVGKATASQFGVYEDANGKKYEKYAKIHFDLPEEVEVDGDICKVNTTTILIECTNYGNVGTGGCGEYWHCPQIYETVIMGKTGFIPEIDLKPGALLSTNAALSGHRSASSSASMQYPYLAADNIVSTAWNAKTTNNGEWVMADFDKPYDLSALELNFGAAPEKTTYNIDVLVRIDDEWVTVADDLDVNADTGIINGVDIDLTGNTIDVNAVKIVYNETNGKAASIAEINATIADKKKCQFLFDYLTVSRKESAATGNIAVYGEPYASTTMDHIGISEVSYINDGGISIDNYAWYSKSFAMGQYCGITLEETSKVNKVVLFFNDGIVGGHDARDYFVFGFDVQAKIDGEYKTVASGTNYNAGNKKYIVAVEFDEVETDDIRILFTDTDIGYVYLKEMEIFGSTKYDDFSTYLNNREKVAKTTNFGAPYIIGRSKFMDLISPVQSIKTINDFRAMLWI